MSERNMIKQNAKLMKIIAKLKEEKEEIRGNNNILIRESDDLEKQKKLLKHKIIRLKIRHTEEKKELEEQNKRHWEFLEDYHKWKEDYKKALIKKIEELTSNHEHGLALISRKDVINLIKKGDVRK